MANRTFRDPEGVLWEAWDVYPGHHSSEGHESRHQLPGGMSDGWLCFQSANEKRRLTPVPAGWDRCEDERLSTYCRLARPVSPRRHQPG